MYSVAVMPIVLGTAIAKAENYPLRWGIFLTFLGAAIFILAWENISNDVFDADTGIDINKAHSLVNLTRNKSLIFAIGNLCLGLGIAGIFAIALIQQDLTVLGLIVLCCGLGYMYQGPPFRLGYQGLGEILCFFAFGPLGVSAAYYSQTQSWSITSLLTSIVLGLTTSLVLFCSHFHQVDDDIAAGKKSPIVRLGTRRGAQLLPWICGLALGILGLLVIAGFAPALTAIAGLSAIPAVRLCRHVGRYHDQPERVSNCKFLAIHFHFWSGVLLSLGFWVGAGV